jgi:dTDP-4-amino-4,6-dideoxygalactose transaminase
MAIKLDFNKPYLVGSESAYINDAVRSGHISGNGKYTKKCHTFFESKYNFPKVLLTSSCTDALEMAAILLNIQPGDEVIMPSYTFVSTANAFALRGAKIVFTDSRKDHPGMDEDAIESLITSRTKAIVPVHYAGVACDMVKIMHIANRHQIKVVEDAAQAIDSYCLDTNGNLKPLGSWGHLAAFSFHETKNIISGEGGMLVINDESYIDRAEIIWEKGTNRSQFFRGQVDKYGWVDIGSSFLPSDIIAAFLYAQLEQMEQIQSRRKEIWNLYFRQLVSLQEEKLLDLPTLPQFATNNAHMFYLVCKDHVQRTALISYLKQQGIITVFHYQSLHKSQFYLKNNDLINLPQADHFTDCLLRLPMFFDLEDADVVRVAGKIEEFIRDGQ